MSAYEFFVFKEPTDFVEFTREDWLAAIDADSQPIVVRKATTGDSQSACECTVS